MIDYQCFVKVVDAPTWKFRPGMGLRSMTR
jgi:hypothetical protein